MNKIPKTTEKTIQFDRQVLTYQITRKKVKNLNLRVRKDGTIAVSAHPDIPEEEIENFLRRKKDFIFRALKEFAEFDYYSMKRKRYISGESFLILGRSLRLKVLAGKKESLMEDGVFIYLTVKDTTDFSRKERLIKRYLNDRCVSVFTEILEEMYQPFQKYDVPFPALKIRKMQTRWGTCLPKKGIVTLNSALLAAPRHCIEYVVLHELCHFLQPNHSRQFYQLLTVFMPNWRERKELLDKNAAFWL